MRSREVKDALYEQFARVGKVTGHPKRLELLDLLCQGERSVDELADAAALKVTTASAHLQALRHARLVVSRRDGRHVRYRAADDAVCRLLQAVQETAAAQLSEVAETVSTHFVARDPVEPIDCGELKRRIDTGEDVVVLDVRPAQEYDAGHIAGASSIPLEELAERLDELPDDAEIVAYCRGPYCVLAPEAVERIHATGRRVRRLDVGFPEWRLAGLPTEAEVVS
ncbi:MAG: metalloregulator ArsR/SmtB family transcription factor [Egibacteraceae bacterium]